LGCGGVEGEVEVKGVGCVAGGVGGYEAEGVDAISEGVAADGFELGAVEDEAAVAAQEGGDVGKFGKGVSSNPARKLAMLLLSVTVPPIAGLEVIRSPLDIPVSLVKLAAITGGAVSLGIRLLA